MIHACAEDPLQCWNVHVDCVKCFISAYTFLEIVVIFASLIKVPDCGPVCLQMSRMVLGMIVHLCSNILFLLF